MEIRYILWSVLLDSIGKRVIYGSTKTVVGYYLYALFKNIGKNRIISLYPLNSDEMYYKCEVCGNFYGIDNL